jgi:hypothetical protein
MFSEHTAPQPAQVTMRTDCTATRAVKVKWMMGERGRLLLALNYARGPDLVPASADSGVGR